MWILGTADERDRCSRLADLCPGCAILDLAGETNLGTLTELLRASDVLITNDSGPMHLAAAVHTPVVAFFGATDPDLTGPYGEGHTVFRTTCDLSPCFSRHCRVENRACSDGIASEEVASAVDVHLQRRFRDSATKLSPEGPIFEESAL